MAREFNVGHLQRVYGGAFHVVWEPGRLAEHVKIEDNASPDDAQRKLEQLARDAARRDKVWSR